MGTDVVGVRINIFVDKRLLIGLEIKDMQRQCTISKKLYLFVSAKYPLKYYAVSPNDDDLKESLNPNRNGDL